MNVREHIENAYPDCVEFLPKEYDEAITGTIMYRGDIHVVYCRDKVIDVLAEDMDLKDAEDYFMYNFSGSYTGDHAPVFMDFDWGDL